ncbi:MAG: hypothetical protein HY585_05225, partial [Candidatus Omnitrophica bacterium]|nr:hypothetical protein [Candidatus Omnitrophota bacterium]
LGDAGIQAASAEDLLMKVYQLYIFTREKVDDEKQRKTFRRTFELFFESLTPYLGARNLGYELPKNRVAPGEIVVRNASGAHFHLIPAAEGLENVRVGTGKQKVTHRDAIQRAANHLNEREQTLNVLEGVASGVRLNLQGSNIREVRDVSTAAATAEEVKRLEKDSFWNAFWNRLFAWLPVRISLRVLSISSALHQYSFYKRYRQMEAVLQGVDLPRVTLPARIQRTLARFEHPNDPEAAHYDLENYRAAQAATLLNLELAPKPGEHVYVVVPAGMLPDLAVNLPNQLDTNRLAAGRDPYVPTAMNLREDETFPVEVWTSPKGERDFLLKSAPAVYAAVLNAIPDWAYHLAAKGTDLAGRLTPSAVRQIREAFLNFRDDLGMAEIPTVNEMVQSAAISSAILLTAQDASRFGANYKDELKKLIETYAATNEWDGLANALVELHLIRKDAGHQIRQKQGLLKWVVGQVWHVIHDGKPYERPDAHLPLMVPSGVEFNGETLPALELYGVLPFQKAEQVEASIPDEVLAEEGLKARLPENTTRHVTELDDLTGAQIPARLNAEKRQEALREYARHVRYYALDEPLAAELARILLEEGEAAHLADDLEKFAEFAKTKAARVGDQMRQNTIPDAVWALALLAPGAGKDVARKVAQKYLPENIRKWSAAIYRWMKAKPETGLAFVRRHIKYSETHGAFVLERVLPAGVIPSALAQEMQKVMPYVTYDPLENSRIKFTVPILSERILADVFTGTELGRQASSFFRLYGRGEFSESSELPLYFGLSKIEMLRIAAQARALQERGIRGNHADPLKLRAIPHLKFAGDLRHRNALAYLYQRPAHVTQILEDPANLSRFYLTNSRTPSLLAAAEEASGLARFRAALNQTFARSELRNNTNNFGVELSKRSESPHAIDSISDVRAELRDVHGVRLFDEEAGVEMKETLSEGAVYDDYQNKAELERKGRLTKPSHTQSRLGAFHFSFLLFDLMSSASAIANTNKYRIHPAMNADKLKPSGLTKEPTTNPARNTVPAFVKKPLNVLRHSFVRSIISSSRLNQAALFLLAQYITAEFILRQYKNVDLLIPRRAEARDQLFEAYSSRESFVQYMKTVRLPDFFRTYPQARKLYRDYVKAFTAGEQDQAESLSAQIENLITQYNRVENQVSEYQNHVPDFNYDTLVQADVKDVADRYPDPLVSQAEDLLLSGEEVPEFFAAGAAIRLGLGNMFLLSPRKFLLVFE